MTADITQEPPPDCYGGDQAGVNVPQQGTGDTCQFNVEIWTNGFGSFVDLTVIIVWETGAINANLEGIIGLGSGGNALFSSPAGSVTEGQCDNFDATCTRVGGTGLIGSCFGTGSEIRVYT